ncbi:MAG: hypothetical protein IJ033_05250 [Clostridia bacterium]|nr:hypothetical protein [Clostridia bacterium]
MKGLAILVALLFALLPLGGVAQGATDTPHVVCHADTWLYTDSGEKLFIIPKSYYARINNLDDNFYYVTFNGVAGKLKKGEVSALGYHTIASGTAVDIGIAEKYSDFSFIQLKKHPDTGALTITEVAYGESFSYLGSYPTDSGELWYMVKYKDFLGYIRAERTTLPEITIPTFVPEVNDVETSVESTPQGEESGNILSDLDSTELKIIIIVGMAVPAIAVIVLLFKPFRKKYD